MSAPERQRRAPRSFFFRYLWPRRRQLLWDHNLVAPLILGAVTIGAVAIFGNSLPGVAPSVSDVARFLVGYAGITFGGCMAGATLSVALSSGTSAAVLALNGSDGVRRRLAWDEGTNSLRAFRVDEKNEIVAVVSDSDFGENFRSRYADLVFVFVYSAFVQLLLAAVSLVAGFCYGTTPTYGPLTTTSALVGVAVLVVITVYSFMQLAACLRALLDLGVVRDESIRGAAVAGDLDELNP